MGPFDWLVDGLLMKAEWRSASVECGEQCVTLAGVAVMPELCADNWGSLLMCLGQVWICFNELLHMFFFTTNSIILELFSGNSTLWISAQLWTRDRPSIPIPCGMHWDRVFSSELQSQRN